MPLKGEQMRYFLEKVHDDHPDIVRLTAFFLHNGI